MKTVMYPDPILTTPCTPYDFLVNLNFAATGMPLHETLNAMAEHMKAESGIGLAANQVGISYRFFIMFDQKGKLWEFINPEITEREGNIAINEGCLSAPGAFVQVPRSKVIAVRAYDRNGNEFKVLCEDIEAVCIQHEMDHLDGIFYLSKTSRNQRRAALKILETK